MNYIKNPLKNKRVKLKVGKEYISIGTGTVPLTIGVNDTKIIQEMKKLIEGGVFPQSNNGD